MVAVLKSSEIQVRPDSYYLDASRKAIAHVLEEAECNGIDDPEEIRMHLHRNYPFGNGDRGGREYKIWRAEVLKAEAALGLEPRRHKETIARENESNEKPSSGKAFKLPDSREELIKRFPEPKTHEQAVVFLRKHTRSMIIMREDYDRLRVVLKQDDYLDRAVKFEISVDVETGDQEEWEEAYLDAAKRTHQVWLANELEKY